MELPVLASRFTIHDVNSNSSSGALRNSRIKRVVVCGHRVKIKQDFIRDTLNLIQGTEIRIDPDNDEFKKRTPKNLDLCYRV
jgi:hypothetical protein